MLTPTVFSLFFQQTACNHCYLFSKRKETDKCLRHASVYSESFHLVWLGARGEVSLSLSSAVSSFRMPRTKHSYQFLWIVFLSLFQQQLQFDGSTILVLCILVCLYFIRGWWQIYFVGKIKIKLFVDSLVQHNKLLRYCKIFFQPHLHLWHHLCLFFNWFQIYCEISAKLRNIQIYKLSQ